MMRLQKYSDMGGIDAVFRQFAPGKRLADHGPTWQTPKLCSSISHVYNKPDEVAMVEIFGARGQDLQYTEMKWWTDRMHVCGTNFMIPHSFNPRAPYDTDCPPYFYNGGFEPRWPLYRVYADYTSRLTLMLTGGRHVCPVAVLFGGNTRQVGKAITPEQITEALQDSLYDCDWLPFEVFERDAAVDGKDVKLHKERYQVLVVPPVEVVPYATLAKVREFFDAGGIVLGYGFLPSKSGTLGRGSKDIGALCEAIWGRRGASSQLAENVQRPRAGNSQARSNARQVENLPHVCKTSPAGGRSYLLSEKPTVAEIQQVLARSAGVPPVLEVLEGETSGWLHVLHRQKAGRDVFLIVNQNHTGAARQFKFRATAQGEPECWDAMRNEVESIPFQRKGPNAVEFSLTLEPLESVLVVFQPNAVARPPRVQTVAGGTPAPQARTIAVARQPYTGPITRGAPDQPKGSLAQGLGTCKWVWYPEGNPAAAAPAGTRYFRAQINLPEDKIKQARFVLTCDNDFVLYVNGKEAGRSDGGPENWRVPKDIDLARHLRPGINLLAIAATNAEAREGANPAGLVGRYTIELDQGPSVTGNVSKLWKTSQKEQQGWNAAEFDDSTWVAAKETALFGSPPWGMLGGRGQLTVSSVAASDPFCGRFSLPADTDLAKARVYVELEDVPDDSARVTINGAYAGGVIGKPLRLNVTGQVKGGENAVEIAPLAPKAVRIRVEAN
jgi:hypothetical protein